MAVISGFPVRFESLSFEDVQETPGNKSAIQAAIDFVSRARGSNGMAKGVLIAGPPGVGKTMLGCVAARMTGLNASFISVSDLVDAHMRQMSLEKIIDKLDVLTDETPELVEYRARKERMWALRNESPVLVLDDLGREHAAGSHWSETLVENFIRHRGDRGLPMLVTTNLRRAERTGRYGEAFESYLREVCELCAIDEGDRRYGEG